jgi:plasmid maintenance system antidote protein VapI
MGTMSQALRAEIIRSKKTRYAIAVGAGIDHAVLRRFINGERDITLQTADKLSSFLGLGLVRRRRTSDSKL